MNTDEQRLAQIFHAKMMIRLTSILDEPKFKSKQIGRPAALR
jgi:hypothetical protein